MHESLQSANAVDAISMAASRNLTPKIWHELRKDGPFLSSNIAAGPAMFVALVFSPAIHPTDNRLPGQP